MTDISTKLVHGGERRKLPDLRSVSTPIYASATFTYDSMEEIDQVFAGEKQGFVYTRYGNPTTSALEEVVRDIEEGAVACAYAAGVRHEVRLDCPRIAGSLRRYDEPA
jgi:methionine-gamma-lyase